MTCFKCQNYKKKITKFSIEGQSNIGETKSKDGFFPSLVLTLIKRLNGRRKKKTLGQKDLERDCCWTFSLAFFLLIWPWRECFYEFRMRTKTSSKTVSRWRWLNPTTTTVLHTYMLRNMMRCFGWFFNWKFAHCQGLNIGTRPHHMQQKLCVCVCACKMS